MAINNHLKEIRSARHLRQAELGTAVKSDGKTIGRYERGERYPNLEMALRLSAYLKLQVNEIFELQDQDFEKDDNE